MVHVNFPLTEIFKHKFPYPEQKYRHSDFEGQRLNRISELWRRWGIFLAIPFILLFTYCCMVVFGMLNDFIYRVVVAKPGLFHQDKYVFMAAGLTLSIPLAVYLVGWMIRVFHPHDHLYIFDRMDAVDGYDNRASVLWFLKVCTGLMVVFFVMSSWAYVRVTDNGFAVKGSFTVFTKQYSYADVRAVHHYKYRTYYSGGVQIDTFDHYQLYLKDGRAFSDIVPSIDEQACLSMMLGRGVLTVVEDSVEVD